MTPIEVMAKAYQNNDNGDCAPLNWDYLPIDGQIESIKDMRAALLALAECELPPEVTDAGFGFEAVQGIKERHARLQARFRAMLRSIAGEPV